MALDPIMLEGREDLRQQMIKEALQEKNPALYRQLKRSNKLKKFLVDREKEMYGTYRMGRDELTTVHTRQGYGPENPLEWVKEYEAAQRRLWSETQATYLEF